MTSNDDVLNEEIAILKVATRTDGTDGWQVKVGEEVERLVSRKNLQPGSATRLISEAVRILSRCVSSTDVAAMSSTGLVVGYVQSGKTLSFTMVSALARDNGYDLIVVLSGVTTALTGQSLRRLKEDLGISGARSRWLEFGNPVNSPQVRNEFGTALRRKRRTLIVTVMKNRTHLDNLICLLQSANLGDVTALVIDDEADQASLNTRARQEQESAIYARIRIIRDLLPRHTYLQYTATPQAPLLINVIDVLSPDFVEVLMPGEDYTGGREFFEREADLIHIIPPSELPTKYQQDEGPPATLLKAMQVYFVGVATGLEAGELDGGNRSMLVHPSSSREIHARYFHWVSKALKEWNKLFKIGLIDASDADFQDLIGEFRIAYEELCVTSTDLPPFDELMSSMDEALSDTQCLEMNTRLGSTPGIDWDRHYSNILVGGEVLNRGFTVEGLTVSYMPRNLGMSQADTLQQRARWLGYKERYIGICRVWLPSDAVDAYRAYVDHEEEMRVSLSDLSENGSSLKDWRRAFFIDAKLKPTRNNVLGVEYQRGNYSDDWFQTDRPHAVEEAVNSNRGLARQFIDALSPSFVEDSGHELRTSEQRHLVTDNVNLSDIYREFLTRLRFADTVDSTKYTGLLLQLARALEENEDEPCVFYLMSKGKLRKRSLGRGDRIKNLYQGQNPKGVSKEDATYPGDQRIHVPSKVSVQLHLLNIEDQSERTIPDVVGLAVWVPKRLGRAWISQ